MTTSVAVFFGGRSVEHEVSVITAMQAIAAFPQELSAVPVYIDKDGAWHTGDGLRTLARFRDIGALLRDSTRVSMRPEPEHRGVLFDAENRRGLLGGGERAVARFDVALPLVHGTHGEDGTLQGLFELNDVAYCGCDVAAAAVSMDKRLAKRAFRGAGLPVLDDVLITRDAWLAESTAVTAAVEAKIAYPLYVKPLSLGSSIGVSRVESRDALPEAVDLALTYDARCIAEPAQDGVVEINCAVLGRTGEAGASACEQPKPGGLLSYEDKYLSKGGPKQAGGKGATQRVIPAPIAEQLTSRVQDLAVRAFEAIGAEGVARVDCLVRTETGEVIVNEINTVPGSLAFYLWEPAGVPFAGLLTRLVELASMRHAAKARTQHSIDTWLLSGRPGA